MTIIIALLDVLTEQEYNEMILVVEGINDVIATSRNEDVDACVTENNRAKMFRPWINTIRWSRYRFYLAMTEDYHDLLSEMMINLLNALGGTYTFERSTSIPDKDHKPLLEWNGKKITIRQGEELVLDGSFDVDESAGFAGFVDGWAKDDEYIGYYTEGKRNGKGCSYGINGEKLKDGMWDMNEFVTGIEYDWLIHVDCGELIYNPKENDYDASGDFAYSTYEQYGINIIPFMNSETCIEHYHLADCYVADLQVDGDTEQLVNIRTLEQYLEKKNPKRLQNLKEMIELENSDEDDSM